MANDEQVRLSAVIAAERRVSDLQDVADDLTTMAQSDLGRKVLKSQLGVIAGVIRKLHDLELELKP